jgi:heavy metal translocating P-type ATPase
MSPLYVVVWLGGLPLLIDIGRRIWARELGADVLAGLSIFVSVAMGQYLVAAILVLMLSGGAALEQFATQKASSILQALAKRTPQIAHRMRGPAIDDVKLSQIAIDDTLIIFPHEICPVDGIVTDGHGLMDESYLTGEPFEMLKTPGSQVFSGAINGDSALTIMARKAAVDSRYAKIVQVLEAAEKNKPRLRRLGDTLAAWYIPATLILAVGAWILSGDSGRFLAVLVVATPCPLLIAIPVAVIGGISLGARRGIIIKNPAALEQIINCRTVIFDKTGTLTYGKPALTEILCAQGQDKNALLRLAASLEQYSKHPLASAIVKAAAERRLGLLAASSMRERPGEGLTGIVAGRSVRITGRGKIAQENQALPEAAPGLECLVFLDDSYAATFRFHDDPRQESASFLQHLFPLHQVTKVVLVSGDRQSEVSYLAQTLGITEVHAGKSPEEKVAIVAEETSQARTLFVGDGINDAPALMAATVGVAFGPNSDITSEAADAVILTSSIGKVDELIHIGQHMRAIALQSAIGGMAVSILGMLAAACGLLSPIHGVIAQEIIDLAAVLNALRATFPPRSLTDF